MMKAYNKLTASHFNPLQSQMDRFLKRRYAKPGKKRLTRERIFILPTYYGVLYAITIFVMLLGSLNYSNNLGFMLTFLLAGVGIVTIFHTYRNISRLSFYATKTTSTFAGQKARFDIVVDNKQGEARQAISLYVHGQTPKTIDVPADGKYHVDVLLQTHKRGRIPYCVLTVETRYPIGLYRAWSYVQINSSCLVYPKPQKFPFKQIINVNNSGDISSKSNGKDDFFGFKHYHPGDSIRHINWKAFARAQQLYTNQYSMPEENSEIWIDWNMLVINDVEQRLSILCQWILDSDEAHLTYGLRLPNKTISPACGYTHKQRCLEALALY